MLIRLLHFEYLSFDEKTSEVFIPNREITREFYEVGKSWQLGRTDPGAGVFGQYCTVMENVDIRTIIFGFIVFWARVVYTIKVDEIVSGENAFFRNIRVKYERMRSRTEPG